MSISLPTYQRREVPLRPRRDRVLAIVTMGLKREFRRPAAIVVIAMGTAITTIISVFIVLFGAILVPQQPRDLTFFYLPVSGGAVLFFVTLIASIVGAGLIADDIHSMALTLYLSRPISPADYLVAKAAILGSLVAMLSVLPFVLTAFLAGMLGLFPWDIALPAMGISLVVGLLLTMFFTAFALFLSSLTRRRAYAGAGVFALTFGLTIPAELLASPDTGIGQSALLYLSPWDNFLAVSRVAFGAGEPPIAWAPALAILLVATIAMALVTYVRMRSMEVVTG